MVNNFMYTRKAKYVDANKKVDMDSRLSLTKEQKTKKKAHEVLITKT